MKVIVVGTGYVGLVQGVCLAEIKHEVVCIDNDADKIKKLQNGISPIYEPEIEALITKNVAAGRLSFSTNLKEYVNQSDIIFIAVGTPSDKDGRADLQYVLAVAEEIALNLSRPTIIACKSTVPVGTNQKIKDLISARYAGDFAVVSNPEFLREGSAITDFMKPDRVIIGSNDEHAAQTVAKLYESLNAPVLITNLATAEMVKYAANSFLATEISFINSIAHVCERNGADISQVAAGMKLDQRIGARAFLNPGLGYGGACFPKDVQALIRIASDNKVNFKILKEVENINQAQRQRFVLKIKKVMSNLSGRKIAVLGLAFKPGTDDVREAPAITIIENLINLGASIVAYDSIAGLNAKKIIPSLNLAASAAEACRACEAVLIITDWPEFKDLDWPLIIKDMKKPLVFDGRNMFSPEKMKALGVEYYSIGRK